MVNGYLKQTVNHVVAESTNLVATEKGVHIFNVLADADTDNGKLVNLDDAVWVANEYFTQVAPTATSRVGLVLSVPMGADEKPYALTLESAFYNEAGEIMRVYDLYKGDKFTVSANGITGSANPAVGDYVEANGYDIKDIGTSAGTKAFLGQIVEKINRGTAVFYKIVVRKNG